MPNDIGFRITGMYFGAANSVTKEIRVDVPKDSPTVYDVMVEVVRKVQSGGVPGVAQFSFDPIFPNSTDSLNSMTVDYNLEPIAGKYGSGPYFLQEDKMRNPVQVFQYYIFDQNNVQKNNNGRTANFNSPPDAPIEEGDTIIWRQLSIMQGPNGNRRILTELSNSLTNMPVATGLSAKANG